MKNKLKTKPVSTKRYLKGLSLAEQDDVEQAVEFALEDPGGTFTRVSQEHSAKLSVLNKTVKSISGDTKHIRKTVDKFDKKIDELTRIIEDGGGGGAGGIGDALPWRTGASPQKPGGPKGRPKLGNALKGAAGMLLLAGALYAIDESAPSVIAGIDKLRPDNSKPMPKIETGWGKGLIGTDIAGAAGQATREWVIKKYKDMFGSKKPKAKGAGIIGRISYQQNNNIQQNFSGQGIKELTPSERAILIRERLKGMTQIPGRQTGGFAPGEAPQYAPGASGSLGQRPGAGGGGGGGGWDGDSASVAPNIPISNGGIEGTKDGGRTGKKTTAAGGKIMTMDEQMAYIKKAAEARGIDPKLALTIAKREGLKGKGNNQAGDWSSSRQQYSSFGPYQLHYGGGTKDGMSNNGLGDEFTKKTGLDARDPTTVQQQIDFSLDHMAKVGHSRDWHGYPNASFANAKPIGITPYAKAEVPAGASAMHAARQVNATDVTQTASTDYDSILHDHDTHKDRPGSTSSIHPAMKARVGAMLRDAPDHVKKELRIVSGYRDPALQANLYAKSGGSGMVAKKSKHSDGMAVDLGAAGAGTAGAGWSKLSPETKQWVKDNAEKYGLYQPLQPGRTNIVEDWHFEPIGSRSGKPNQPVADINSWKDPGLQTTQMAQTPVPGNTKLSALVDMTGIKKTIADKSIRPHVNPDRKFPDSKTAVADSTATPNRDAHFAKIDAAIAASKKKKAEKVASRDYINPNRKFPGRTPKAELPLTPAETAGKGDIDRRTGLERLYADKSTDGLSERAKAYAMNQDKYPQPDRIFPNARPVQSLPIQASRPVAAAVTPEPQMDMLKAAQDMAQAAIDKAKEAAKMVTDYVKSGNDSAPPAANRIPRASKSAPPLTNPPRTYHRATQTTNPTQKTPGSDSSKTFDSTKEDPSLWQYPAVEFAVP